MVTNSISDSLALPDSSAELGVEQGDASHRSLQSQDSDPVLADLRGINTAAAVIHGLVIGQRALSDVLLRER
jgi:hypothetical protein